MNSKLVKKVAAFIAAVMLVSSIPAVISAQTSTAVTSEAVVDEAQTALVHFVNHEDTTKKSSVANFLANPKTYTKDGVNYFRVDVQQVYDVGLTVAGKEGTKVSEYTTTVQGRNGAEEVTYFTFDYVVEDLSAVIEANTTYMVPGFFTEPQSHDLFIVINNDVDAVLAELNTSITKAEAAEPKTEALTAALANAKKVNNLVTKKAEIEAALKALTLATAENPTNADVYFVNISDTSKISSMASYLANPKTYTKDSVTYLRLDVMQKYDVKVTVEGKEGVKVAEYTATVQGRQGAEEVTFFTFDYAVEDLSKVFTASASYFVPGVFQEPQSHDIYVSVNKNVDAELAALHEAIALAEAAVEQTEQLTQAIDKAKESATLITPAADIVGATNSVVNALAKVNVFTDTADHWAKGAIAQAYANGMVNGYGEGIFKPNQTMTRAEFTKIIVSGLNLPDTEQQLSFADNDQIAEWAVPYVEQAVAANVITGYTDNTFGPSKNITRAEMAVMVVKALGLEVQENAELTFADAEQIPAYAKPYIAVAVEKGLIVGLEGNKFGPNQSATRAEAATVVLRAANQ